MRATIEEYWKNFNEVVIVEEPLTKEDLRWAFYCGATIAYSLVFGSVDDTRSLLRRMTIPMAQKAEALRQELKAFEKEIDDAVNRQHEEVSEKET